MTEQQFVPAAPIRRILVPLDGSRIAEEAIPAAISIAAAFGGEILLFHVLEMNPPEEIHGQRHLTRTEESIAYLEQTVAGYATPRVSIDAHVHEQAQRSVSAGISEHAEEMGVDLIVMANHGSGGLRGFLFGRVAQQVLQQSRRPVLAIPVSEQEAAPLVAIRRIALLLNRTEESESAIPIALTFATTFGASIALIHVVPTAGALDSERQASAMLMPSAAREVLNIEERAARRYLDDLAGRLTDYGIRVITLVIRGDPGSEAVAAAERAGADLMVFTTHARGGLGGLWRESVGSKVLARSSMPMLLVPAGT